MLNIGRLAPGAAEYYLGEIASSAEDYYTGRGESAGRWVGSLAPELGLEGTVAPEHFRAVLDGRHPISGERLARARAGGRRQHAAPNPNQGSLFDHDTLDVARTASRLRVSARRVRQLLTAGSQVRAGVRPSSPRPMLFGRRAADPGRAGPAAWHIPRAEVERYEATFASTKARPGYDVALRPPKSVSVLWALAPQHQRNLIRDAHREAVDATVAYLESHAVHARRGTKDRGRIECDGVVAAAFDHRTSRAGDPLLHTHVVVANLTRTAEGKWQAVDARGLFDHAHSGGFLYQAHLRHTLARTLGVTWTDVRNGWAEIDGVPDEVIRAFSKRRDEIEEVVAESGYTSARAHQSATLATRKAKDYDVDAAGLEDRWRGEAEALGFGPAEVAACFEPDIPGQPPAVAETDTELFAWLAGPEGLTRHASSFARRDVVKAIAERLRDRASAAVIEDAADRFLASGLAHSLSPDEPAAAAAELVWRRGGTRSRSHDLTRWSTPELLRLEAGLLDAADHGFGVAVPSAAPAAIEDAIARRPELSDEQIAMVRAVAGPGAPAVQAVAGRPGAGKTHATAAVVEALHRSGMPVVGCSLSATAAAELEAATRLGPLTGRPATTIARLLFDLDNHGLAPGGLIVIDEASMVGTRDLARLAAHAGRAAGALKLVGDPDQHGAVETGGFFQTLAHRHPERLVSLVENNRQIYDDDRAAIDFYRQGLVPNALARYDAAGHVVRSATAATSYDAMVADWWDAARAGSTDPMIAGPNAIRFELNRRARTRMKQEGLLDGPAVDARGREFCQGDWVVARRNDRELRSASGHFVKNGSAGHITAVDADARQLTVDFAVEGRITIPASYLDDGHLEHGYARTTYGVQGATLERALYHAGDRSSFEEGYVALTRGRAETRIYLVDGALPGDDETAHPGREPEHTGLDVVAEAMEQRRAKVLAHDIDATAGKVAARYAGAGLGELRAARDALEALLDDAPADPTGPYRAATRRRDALLTRQRLTPADDNDRARRLRAELAGVDERIERLRRQLAERRRFLDDHRDEVTGLHTVGKADKARALAARIQAVAHTDDATVELIGHRPTGPVAGTQLWDAAVEHARVHTERWGIGPASGSLSPDIPESLLGSPPPDPHARWSHGLAADSIRRAINRNQAAEAPTLE